MAEPNTGDTPPEPGSVRLYEPSDPPFVEPEGDTRVEGEVHLVHDYQRSNVPTAGELRALDYPGVDASLGDDELVYGYAADSPLPAGQVRLYEERPETPGGPAPEDPTISTVTVEEQPTAVPDPSGEENAATSEEERSEAEAEADQLRDQTDPVYSAGRQAATNGELRSSNPYDGRSKDGKTWGRGFDSVEA